jgi:hypothetical protein
MANELKEPSCEVKEAEYQVNFKACSQPAIEAQKN